MRGMKSLGRVLALIAVIVGAGAMTGVSPASAEDTVWLCKPGDPDDLCAGTISGENLPAPGQSATPLGYTRPAEAPVDCFYLYPTQSSQATPNSNLEKDPPIRRVAVQQARMFSSVCDVYAPMYRQVTYSGSQAAYNDQVETAYQSALAGFRDYLKNHNEGRGFILLGHSQGSAHTVRLIGEEIDNNPGLRKRLVGAFAPGANVHVPIGQPVGGMYENVPACTAPGETGCLVAFSIFKGYPGDTAQYSRLNSGYWIYDQPRPDPSVYEVMCVNPARIDGGNGRLKPLINFDYLFDVPSGPESESPWRGQPDFYAAECTRQNGAHWLNLSTLDTPGDTRVDLGAAVASGNNYHVPEVNLAEGNMLTVAQNQAGAYVLADATARRKKAATKLRTTKTRYRKRRAEIRKTTRRIKKSARKCRKASGARKKAACKTKRRLKRKKANTVRRARRLNRQSRTLTAELKRLDAIIDENRS
jgi:hypothetical protein